MTASRDADVPCPGCGRPYPAARFEGGRTLHCTCGARVGRAPTPGPAAPGAPRFAVDAMLGRLALWLRLLGFDAFYEADVDDAALARRALDEGRILLTRDRALAEAWTVPGLTLVASEDSREQLREVARRFGLAAHARPFSRCSRCNAELEPASREAVLADVPPRVAATHVGFLRCPGCRRVYWEGSHVERMRRVLGEALEPPGSALASPPAPPAQAPAPSQARASSAGAKRRRP